MAALRGYNVDLITELLNKKLATHKAEILAQYQMHLDDIANEVRNSLSSGTSNLKVTELEEVIEKVISAKLVDPPISEVGWSSIDTILVTSKGKTIDWKEVPHIQLHLEQQGFPSRHINDNPLFLMGKQLPVSIQNKPRPKAPEVSSGISDGEAAVIGMGVSGQVSIERPIVAAGSGRKEEPDIIMNDRANDAEEWSSAVSRTSPTPNTVLNVEHCLLPGKDPIDFDEVHGQRRDAESTKENRAPLGQAFCTPPPRVGGPGERVKKQFTVCGACGALQGPIMTGEDRRKPVIISSSPASTISSTGQDDDLFARFPADPDTVMQSIETDESEEYEEFELGRKSRLNLRSHFKHVCNIEENQGSQQHENNFLSNDERRAPQSAAELPIYRSRVALNGSPIQKKPSASNKLDDGNHGGTGFTVAPSFYPARNKETLFGLPGGRPVPPRNPFAIGRIRRR